MAAVNLTIATELLHQPYFPLSARLKLLFVRGRGVEILRACLVLVFVFSLLIVFVFAISETTTLEHYCFHVVSIFI